MRFVNRAPYILVYLICAGRECCVYSGLAETRVLCAEDKLDSELLGLVYSRRRDIVDCTVEVGLDRCPRDYKVNQERDQAF